MMKKQNRNDPCTCGSGKKFKKCCGSTNLGRKVTMLSDATPIKNLFNQKVDCTETKPRDIKVTTG